MFDRSNRDDCITSSSVWLSVISNHFPTFIYLKPSGTVRNDDILVRFFNKKFYNRQIFSNRVYSFPWNDLLTSSADRLCGRFLDALHLLYDETFPYKSCRKKFLDMRKPCINNEIHSHIKRKHRLQRLYTKYPVTYEKQYVDC